jgi:S-(hydroxymethyl)glutathione dehydrogenase/alcohol dehydrogenase
VAAGGEVREAVLALTGRGVDHAFEVVGRPALVAQALTLVRPGGTAYVVGILPPRSEITVTRESLMGERRLMTSSGGTTVAARGIPVLVDLYRSGQLRLDEMISSRIPLERVDEAFAGLETGEAARTVVVFPS